jgi:hypothetical protein
MNILRNNLVGPLLVFLFTSLLLLFWFSFYAFHPDSYFISLWGDGFKNYYTFAYYVAYDHGWHFTGMNYPFGEHIVFTDDQPILAISFRYLSHLHFVKQHLHGIFTMLTFLSVPICASIVYLLFAEYGMGGLYVAVSSVFIALLSPQIFRISGHFGLSYCFFLPLSILLITKASTTGRSIYLFFFSTAVIIFGLIHIYHLAIISFFALVYSIFDYSAGERNKDRTIFFLKQIAAALIPFLFIKGIMFFTDGVTDRPDNPWGFFDSSSTYDSVFLTPFGFVYQFISRFVHMPTAAGERLAYIGIVADVILVLFIGFLIFRFTLSRRVFRGFSRTLLIAFASSVVLLLFSFGLPFSIESCRWLFDYMGPLKQFRAPCRFAWAFYYMANIFCIVYIARLSEAVYMRKWLKTILAVCMFALWLIDIHSVNTHYINEWSKYGGRIDMKDDRAKINDVLEAKGFSARNFQAILYLPFFSIGSEKTFIPSSSDIAGMKISLCTGLGLVDIEMSRTSLSQVDMNLQLFSNTLLHKEVLKFYPSRLPLLLSVGVHGKLTESERALISRATLIGRTYIYPDTVMFYNLPLRVFNDSAAVVRAQFDHMASDMAPHEGYLSMDTTANIVVESYDNRSAPFTKFGKGALYFEKRNPVLFEGCLPHALDSGIYEFSIWNYGDHRIPIYPVYHIGIYNKEHKLIVEYEKKGYESTDVFENWIRTNCVFMLPSADYIVKIDAKGDFATYDELMIRPVGLEVLTHYNDKNLFMYNNYPITK